MLQKCVVEKAEVAAIQKTIALLQLEVKNATGTKKRDLEQQLHAAEVDALKLQEKLNLCLAKK